MPNQFTASVTYYLSEGKENLRQTIEIAIAGARAHKIEKIVIFTSQGDGVRLAFDMIQESGGGISLVAVTFPQGMQFLDEKGQLFTTDISEVNKHFFAAQNIPIIRAHLPFSPIPPHFQDRGVLANDLSLVENALNIFGGSMSLCVQAVLMACDAGGVFLGEHVIACTSDTAILARATCTTRLLREFIIREILCKPAVFDIGKKEKRSLSPEQPLEIQGEVKVLPENSETK